MANSRNIHRVLGSLLFSSLGLLTMELLRPAATNAQSCTIDPFGGEVWLADTKSHTNADAEPFTDSVSTAITRT